MSTQSSPSEQQAANDMYKEPLAVRETPDIVPWRSGFTGVLSAINELPNKITNSMTFAMGNLLERKFGWLEDRLFQRINPQIREIREAVQAQSRLPRQEATVVSLFPQPAPDVSEKPHKYLWTIWERNQDGVPVCVREVDVAHGRAYLKHEAGGSTKGIRVADSILVTTLERDYTQRINARSRHAPKQGSPA